MTALYLMVFLFGAIVGSFLNLCALRIPKGEPIVVGRSVCPQCKHVLGATDLIPILSYILLRGKCRYCRQRISFRYVGTELISGLLFTAVFAAYGFTVYSVIYTLLTGILLVAALIDLEHMYIPNGLILFGLTVGTTVTLFLGSAHPKSIILGFLAGGVPMTAIYLLSRGGMGAGDVKLGAVLGVFLGWKLALAGLFLSFLSASVVGLLLIFSGKKTRKDALPFAPFLAAGGFAAALWGTQLINCYLTLGFV